MSVFDLGDVYLWLDGKGGAEKEKGGPEFWGAIGENPHVNQTLVSVYENNADWQMWERHPAGDEVLVALSGVVTILIEAPGGLQRHLMKAGDTVVVPAGCWHSAEIQEPGRMLFLTHGEGTEHRPKTGV